MDAEFKSLKKYHTWELVVHPKNRKVIGNKWIYKIKNNPKGNTTRYKARLVIKGFAQQKGIDFEEIFAPVVRLTTLRVLFAMAAKLNLDIDHLHLVTAFFHGRLEKDIYMEQPKEYVTLGQENKVCKLKKAIYGLKQGNRVWNLALDKALRELDF